MVVSRSVEVGCGGCVVWLGVRVTVVVGGIVVVVGSVGGASRGGRKEGAS